MFVVLIAPIAIAVAKQIVGGAVANIVPNNSPHAHQWFVNKVVAHAKVRARAVVVIIVGCLEIVLSRSIFETAPTLSDNVAIGIIIQKRVKVRSIFPIYTVHTSVVIPVARFVVHIF